MFAISDLRWKRLQYIEELPIFMPWEDKEFDVLVPDNCLFIKND